MTASIKFSRVLAKIFEVLHEISEERIDVSLKIGDGEKKGSIGRYPFQ